MKLTKKAIYIILTLSLCYIGGYLINMFVSKGFVFDFEISTDYLLAPKTLLYTFEFAAIIGLIWLFSWYKGLGKNPKKIIESSEKDKQIFSGLEQAHFQTDKEIAKNFTTIDYNKLPNVDIEGIPVKAEENGLGYKITFAKPAHALIIGTTGSGKTTTYINPTIQILSNTRSQPSMLVTDPKGELYALHAKSLIKRGYDVKVLDLRNPYCSVRWNPLEKPYELYQQMLALDDQVRYNEEKGYWIFEDKIYYGKEEKTIKELFKNIQYWKEDSLYLNESDDENMFLFENKYLNYFLKTLTPNGKFDFEPFGVNYYSKERAQNILNELLVADLPNSNILCKWLTKCVESYQGFYILGI